MACKSYNIHFLTNSLQHLQHIHSLHSLQHLYSLRCIHPLQHLHSFQSLHFLRCIIIHPLQPTNHLLAVCSLIFKFKEISVFFSIFLLNLYTSSHYFHFFKAK